MFAAQLGYIKVVELFLKDIRTNPYAYNNTMEFAIRMFL